MGRGTRGNEPALGLSLLIGVALVLGLGFVGGRLLGRRAPSVAEAPQPSPLLHPCDLRRRRLRDEMFRGPPRSQLPPNRLQVHSAAYAKAIANGDERPGEAAFRATIDAFMDHNRAFAEARAAEEKISLEEVKELTYFGFLVLQTQQWPEIEALTGHELGEKEREQAANLMHATNSAFKSALRKLVADGVPPEARWSLIRETQERYKREYAAITGMTPELLDDLLAGDPSRPGAPSATPIPDNVRPAPPPEPTPVRPTTPP